MTAVQAPLLNGTERITITPDGMVAIPTRLLDTATVRHLTTAIPNVDHDTDNGLLTIDGAASPFAYPTLGQHLLDLPHVVDVTPPALLDRMHQAVSRYARAINDSQTVTIDPERRTELLGRLPDPIAHAIRPYQLAGIDFVTRKCRGRGFLGDDPGAGKCAHPETRVVLNGTNIAIGDVWDRYATTSTIRPDPEVPLGEWADPRVPLEVPTLNADGTAGRGRVTGLYRQHVNETLYEIRTTDGRTLRATGQHRLLGPHGWVRIDDLAEGDPVGRLRTTPWNGMPVDSDIATLLAWQIGEGHEVVLNNKGKDYQALRITLKDRETLTRIADTYRDVAARLGSNHRRAFSVRPTKNGTWIISPTVKDWYRWLMAHGYEWGHKSATKRIPDFMVAADRDSTTVFLREYFAAEGSVPEGSHEVELTSASRVLIDQIVTMLDRYGIWARTHKKRKMATNGKRIKRTYWTITISGESLLTFAKEIGIADPVKQTALDELVTQMRTVDRNPNADVLPISALLRELWDTTRLPALILAPNLGVVEGRYAKGISPARTEEVIRRLDAVLDGAAEAHYRTLRRSKWTDRTLQAFADLDRGYVRDVRDTLQRLVDQQTTWTTVAEITATPYEGYVYDLEVDGTHNYVAGGLISHNTIQAISALYVPQPTSFPAIVVCKATLKANWVREFTMWTGDTVESVVLQGQTNLGDSLPHADVYIVNYELLHHRLDDLLRVRPRALIVDESQMLKTVGYPDAWVDRYHETEKIRAAAKEAGEKIPKKLKPPATGGAWRTWAAKKIAHHPTIQTVLLLSATPAPNGRNLEWLPQIDLLDRLDDLGGTDAFIERYARWCKDCVDEITGQVARECTHRTYAQRFGRRNDEGSINSAELATRLRSLMMVRRSQRQMYPDLPPIQQIPVDLPMAARGTHPETGETVNWRTEYKQAEDEFVQWLKDHAAGKARVEGENVGRAVARAASTSEGDFARLVQLSHLRKIAAYAKMDAVVDWLGDWVSESPDGDEPRQAVVFAWHKTVQKALIDRLGEWLDSAAGQARKQRLVAAYGGSYPGVPSILAATEMSGDEIEANKARFNNNPDEPFIVCSIAAAAEGHSLSRAALCAAVEQPQTGPGTLRQMAGRSYGRADNPSGTVLALMNCIDPKGTIETIDQRLYRAMMGKQVNMATVLDHGQMREIERVDAESMATDVMGDVFASYLS